MWQLPFAVLSPYSARRPDAESKPAMCHPLAITAILAFCGMRGMESGTAADATAIEAHANIATATGPLEPTVPVAWTPPQGRQVVIDFAVADQADAWLRHVALGDPSFDSFQHASNNPIVQGKPPFEWPVNGFFFEDPKSGHWYAYVGNYLAGYAVGPDKPAPHCTVYRSSDRGVTWNDCGPIFTDRDFRFEGDTRRASVAPDVSVVFDVDRYHMAYDWCTDNTTWANAFHPTNGADNGCAYAWAERPEGPFHRQSRPILRTSEFQQRFPMAWKYRRAYGTSLVRRSRDWLALVLTDSGEFYSWGILALTAPTPQGPWSEPVFMLGIEGSRYFPPTVESFPAFVHDGYVYSPATSVAENRNFQVIYRATIEQAHDPTAWRLFQNGSVWHADNVSHEGLGIWGQTFSGFVDPRGQFQVLFPSRASVSGAGTINFASRPWKQPLRERGFVLSGHAGRSLTLLRSAYRGFELETKLAVRGKAVCIVWSCQAPLGPDRHAAGATLHSACLTRQQRLKLCQQAWQIESVDDQGKASAVAGGPLLAGTTREVELALQNDGQTKLIIDGQPAWSGRLPVAIGPIGLLVDQESHLTVERFVVAGVPEPAVFPFLYTEALTGAGVKMDDWNVEHSPAYRFGVGAVRKSSGGRVKWNFHGRGFRLWLPRGPRLGRCAVMLNGETLAELDLHADQDQPSRVLFSRDALANAYHALVLQSISGRLAVDSLDVVN
jgi:hypothetical protein